MPRPRRRRWIRFAPDISFFGPQGMEAVDMEEVGLTLDELEAIRLKDLEAIDQKEAAEGMNISQPTFHRLLTSAHKKIAEALVRGKGIRIEGGDFKIVEGFERKFTCLDCSNIWVVAHGVPRPEKCPTCDSHKIHRVLEGAGYGFGSGPGGGKGRGRGRR